MRLQRDGVAVTYILPPIAPASAPAVATLPQLRYFVETHYEIAAHKLRAAPDCRIYAHDLAVFAGLARLIQSVFASDVIKAELRDLARDRVAAERAAIAAEAASDGADDAERGA